jgi:type IV pilus assembly protein PilA
MFSSAIQRLNDRHDSVEDAGEDAGFTLIELMVVLLILAILLAIAIPTFLGVTKSANDRSSQSNLNTALINGKSIFQTNSQQYPVTATIVTSLTSAEPNLTFQQGAVTYNNAGQQKMSVYVDPSATATLTGQGFIVAAQAKGGNCWYIIDNAVAETSVAAGYGAGVAGFPVAAGTWYGEAKNTGSAPTCDSSAPAAQAAGSTSVLYQQANFPNL